jgi:hypothetical protein
MLIATIVKNQPTIQNFKSRYTTIIRLNIIGSAIASVFLLGCTMEKPLKQNTQFKPSLTESNPTSKSLKPLRLEWDYGLLATNLEFEVQSSPESVTNFSIIGHTRDTFFPITNQWKFELFRVRTIYKP